MTPQETAEAERLQRRNVFLADNEADPESCRLLAGDASFRKYWRVHHRGVRRVLMDAPPAHEDIVPFITVTEMLRECGLMVPRIYAHDTAQGWIIMEDLGDSLFARVLEKSAKQEEVFYHTAIENLLLLHDAPADIYARLSPYDSATYMREVSLFCDWFMPQLVGTEIAASLRESYLDVWRGLLAEAPLQEDVLVHRDYHAENLLWQGQQMGTHRVGVLDYQDALRGDAAYDVVSLLEDARRDVAPEVVHASYSFYIESSGEDPDAFQLRYQLLGAQRNSKIIGIFTRLAARDNKHHYLKLLPRVWSHLERDMRHPYLAPLRHWVKENVPFKTRNLSQVDVSIGSLAA